LKFEDANNTIIKIVIAADMAEDVSRRELLLNWAQCLSNWNLKYSQNSEIAIINDLQIKSRVRKLNSKEMEILSNILVNTISPGFIDTEMNKNFEKEELEAIFEEIPLGRAGKTSEVADLVYKIATSKYLTGQIITIDGGWT